MLVILATEVQFRKVTCSRMGGSTQWVCLGYIIIIIIIINLRSKGITYIIKYFKILQDLF